VLTASTITNIEKGFFTQRNIARFSFIFRSSFSIIFIPVTQLVIVGAPLLLEGGTGLGKSATIKAAAGISNKKLLRMVPALGLLVYYYEILHSHISQPILGTPA